MSSTPSHGNLRDGLTLAEFFKILSQRKALVLVLALISVVTSVLVTMTLPKRYKATAEIRVTKTEVRPELWNSGIMATFDPYFVRESMDILGSGSVITPLLKEPKLRAYIESKMGGTVNDDLALMYVNRGMLEVESTPGTSIVRINVRTEEEPKLAADLANAIVRQYEDSRVEFSVGEQNKAFKQWAQDLESQRARVAKLQQDVEAIRKKYNITEEGTFGRSSGERRESLAMMERGRVVLLQEVQSAHTKWQNFAKIPVSERINMISSQSTPDPILLNLREKYFVDEQQFEQVKKQVGEGHPDYTKAAASLAKIRTQLDQTMEAFVKGLEFAYNAEKAKLEQMDLSIKETKDRFVEEETKIRPEWDRALTDLRSAERLLETTEITFKQREMDRKMPGRPLERLNPAVAPQFAYFPKMWLHTLGGLVLGLFMGVACAFLIEFFDNSFRSVEHIERVLGTPILGVVPRQSIRVRSDNFNTFESESYRVIQTHLESLKLSLGGNVFAVQSAGPGEGKSTTLHNVASVSALSGRRVLVIDSDVRRPSQHKLFKVKSQPGLVDILSGKLQLSQAIQRSEVDGLDFLPSGSGAGAKFSLSIMQSHRLGELLKEVSAAYDFVFLDSPPVIGISDGAVLGSQSTGVIMVVQHKRNPASMVIRARQIILGSGSKLVGVVLNQVPSGGGEDYDFYTSNYKYYNGSSEKEGRASERNSEAPEQFTLEETELTRKNKQF